MGYHFAEWEMRPLWSMFLAAYSQLHVSKPWCGAAWGNRGMCPCLQLTMLWLPQLPPSCTLTLCRREGSLQPLQEKGTKDSHIFGCHHDSSNSNFRDFGLFRPLAMAGRCQLSSPLGDIMSCAHSSQPWPLTAHGSKANLRMFWFFCLDLSRLNTAVWDTRDKVHHLFAFYHIVGIFLFRIKSGSPQMLQACSRQCCWRWPGTPHSTNQRTKKLPAHLKHLQPKCEVSDNRWEKTDGGVEGKKGGNISECDRKGSWHIGSLVIGKFFWRHHVLRLYLESYRFYTWFSGK